LEEVSLNMLKNQSAANPWGLLTKAVEVGCLEAAVRQYPLIAAKRAHFSIFADIQFDRPPDN
jgi:hypothetical protein